MPKKKKGYGLSRKQIQKLTRLTRLTKAKPTYGVRLLVPDSLDPKPKDVIKVEIKPTQSGCFVVGPSKKLQRVKLGSRVVGNPAHIIAATAVEASSKSVLGDLGIKILDVSAKPESVHTLGSLIAAKAIVMATTMGPKGRVGGAGGVLASIGRSSIDVAVSPDGEISTSVVGPARKIGGNVSKPGVRYHTHVFPSAPDGGGGSCKDPAGQAVSTPTTKEKKPRKKKDIEVGETTVIKDKNGITHIHIHSLNLYITADLVQQLNVNPQLVQNVLAEKLTGFAGQVEQKALASGQQNIKTSEKDEEEDDDKKKTKKKKKKGVDDEK